MQKETKLPGDLLSEKRLSKGNEEEEWRKMNVLHLLWIVPTVASVGAMLMALFCTTEEET